MFEGIPSNENPKEDKIKEEKKDEGISRRDFLKKIAMISGGLVAGGVVGEYGVGKYNKWFDERVKQAEIQERVYVSDGVVTKKEFIPGNTTVSQVGKIPIVGHGPDRWGAHIRVKGEEQEIELTKEQYDSIADGEVVSCKYQEPSKRESESGSKLHLLSIERLAK